MKKFYWIFRRKFLELGKWGYPQGIIAEVDGICYDYLTARKIVKLNKPAAQKILSQFFGNGGENKSRQR